MNFFQAAVPLGAWTRLIAFVIVLALMLLIPLAMFLMDATPLLDLKKALQDKVGRAHPDNADRACVS